MINKNNFKLSIIIPCYNEEKTIYKIIVKILAAINDYNITEYEIIIVDDNSVDGTKEILEKIKNQNNIKILYHKYNLGKGAALQTGIQNVTGDITIIQDADLEYDPSDYNKLLLPFFETEADVVYGSRFLGGGKYIRIHFFWHYLANKILTFICNIFTNLNMTDMETGYKAFRTEVIKKINLKEKSFTVEPEITIKLAKKKFRFYEVPITYNGRTYSEGKKIRLKDAFYALYAIIRYGFD
ncbi:glycosyltransferase family 2 protein [Pelagibacteraceae bacterium]|nr:glycosyltransferase family 2 protein [Pelagibacteraceae bacterium]